MIADLLHDETGVWSNVMAETGTSLLTYIEGLEPKLHPKILDFELNDGTDLKTHQRHLQKTLQEKNKGAKILQTLVVLGMCFLLTVMSGVFLEAIYSTKPLPSWEIAAILFGCPVLVIWQYQGVLSAENKDFLFAALGKTPPGNMVSTIASAFRGRSREGDMQVPFMEQRGKSSATPPPPPAV